MKCTVQDGHATMIHDDGNGREHPRQDIPYTDFPLYMITLYVCWDGALGDHAAQ